MYRTDLICSLENRLIQPKTQIRGNREKLLVIVQQLISGYFGPPGSFLSMYHFICAIDAYCVFYTMEAVAVYKVNINFLDKEDLLYIRYVKLYSQTSRRHSISLKNPHFK